MVGLGRGWLERGKGGEGERGEGEERGNPTVGGCYGGGCCLGRIKNWIAFLPGAYCTKEGRWGVWEIFETCPSLIYK